jgi:hypothetical protein
MDDKKVRELLVKLSALRKKAATEGEAQAAAAAMQRLLLKYNLSLSKVLLEAEGQAADNGIVKDTFRFSERYQSKTWKQQLLFGVAQYNFVKALTHGENRGSFIGRPENVYAVRQLFDYLCEELERLSQDELIRAQGYERRPRGKWQWAKVGPNTVRTHGRTWRQAFLLGAVHRLEARMADNYYAIVEEEKARAATQTTALITLNDAAIDSFVKTTWGKIGHRSYDTDVGDWGGYEKGQAVAEGISLAGRPKQIGASGKLLES